jgi:methionine sulfoxide reductase heme-binding subunit
MRWFRRHWHRLLAHVVALAPLVLLVVDGLRDELTVNPNRYLLLRTGSVGLVLLVASLACTPLGVLTGWPRFVEIRRPLVVYGFIYSALHLLIYAALDNGFDPYLIWRDLGERRSMSVGLVALAVLVPLVLTSTAGWQRRLGRGWRTLHRLVYLAVPLTVLHFYWLDRDFKNEPLIYAAIVAGLLALRLPPVRRAIVRTRQRLRGSRRPGSARTPQPADRG